VREAIGTEAALGGEHVPKESRGRRALQQSLRARIPNLRARDEG